MIDYQHGSNDNAGNLPARLSLAGLSPLRHHLSAVEQGPAQQQTQGDQVQDDQLEGGNPNQSHLVMPQGRTDVEVQKEDDDGVDQRGKDGQPREDVEEDADQAAQPTHHHHPGVECQGVQQVLKVDVDLPAGLTVNGATCE